MLAWMTDRDVGDNIGLRKTPTLDSTRQWIERAQNDSTISPQAIHFRDVHVGNVVLDQIDSYLQIARVHIYIGDPEMRGKGIGSQAMKLALMFAFERLGLVKVWLTVHCENAAAIASYIRCGFRLEGILKGEFLLNGRRIDALRMGITADEFRSRHGEEVKFSL
ncbi:Spermidine N(1)-acetyltransferase [Bremerella volcania]|uniref:Spermidine N(1)-acetyltransferase n=2 Tax=Bremerella volcania TaxID=2527984 RepID=A0A518C847_9BACT|nr:Spermidine N(1)-acetyltransferase [Bremerella volcania]